MWEDLLNGGDFDGIACEPDSGDREDGWNARWIPPTDSGLGDHHSVDLDLGADGTIGQVILICHNMPDRPLVVPNFAG